jgi:ubiquinone/menaquinone biosynthesis C-methylase UbiE
VSEPSEPGWSDIAVWYDELVQSGSGPHETALKCTVRLAGDLTGQDVLDIACGQGHAARALARAGARSVTGIDSSPAMLGLARRHEEARPLGVIYLEDDAQTLATITDRSLDGVNCQLGLMDIPDLPATLAAVHRVLRAEGWFTFVIGHPCFLTPYAITAADRTGRTSTSDSGARRTPRASAAPETTIAPSRRT